MNTKRLLKEYRKLRHPRRHLDTFGVPGRYGSDDGKLLYVCHGKGYVMVRRPEKAPFVMSLDRWNSLPLFGVKS